MDYIELKKLQTIADKYSEKKLWVGARSTHIADGYTLCMQDYNGFSGRAAGIMHNHEIASDFTEAMTTFPTLVKEHITLQKALKISQQIQEVIFLHEEDNADEHKGRLRLLKALQLRDKTDEIIVLDLIKTILSEPNPLPTAAQEDEAARILQLLKDARSI